MTYTVTSSPGVLSRTPRLNICRGVNPCPAKDAPWIWTGPCTQLCEASAERRVDIAVRGCELISSATAVDMLTQSATYS